MKTLRGKAKALDKIAIEMEAETEDSLRKAEIRNIRAVIVMIIDGAYKIIRNKEISIWEYIKMVLEARSDTKKAITNASERLLALQLNTEHAGNHEQFRNLFKKL